MASPIVGIGPWCFAEQRRHLFDRFHGEGRVGQILLGAGHRRENEAASQARDPPRQSELDGLAYFAADDRIELGDVQVDDLAHGDEACA